MIRTIAIFLSLAASVAAETLTPAEAVARALAGNPSLRAAELEIARAEARVRGAGRLSNPELEIGMRTDEFGNNDEEGAFEIAFTQRFPVTSRLRHERQLATLKVQEATAEVALARLQIAREVDGLALQCLAGAEQISARTAQAKVQEEIADFLTTRAESGEGSPLDAAEPRLASRMLTQGSRMLELQNASAIAQLRPLLGMDANQKLAISGDLALPKTSAVSTGDLAAAVARRPEFRLATLRADAADTEILLARDGRWEDIAVGIFAEHEHAVDAPFGNESNDLIGIGVSIPLPLWNDNRAAVEDAEIGRRQAGMNAEAIARQVRAEIAAAAEMATLAHKLAQASVGEPMKLAEENLASIREAQAKGQASATDVQRALAQKLELEEARLDLLITYHEALADLRHARADYPGLWRGLAESASTGSKNPRK